MSTRAYIRITKEGAEPFHLHRTCDGYPSETGSDLVDVLEDYQGSWEPKKLGEYIIREDHNFEWLAKGPMWDHEYIYIIDCDKKKLSAYHKGISSPRETREEMMDSIGDELLIEGNHLNGVSATNNGATKAPEAPDWAAYRREAAKEAMLKMLMSDFDTDAYPDPQEICGMAVLYADELIKQLKEK